MASDRLLNADEEGRLGRAGGARDASGFSDAGILVHAYLMYGFPTQTVQDTVDALEYVRQLFEAGCIQSRLLPPLHLHRAFAGRQAPGGVRRHAACRCRQVTFAKNDIGFIDPTGVDHDALGVALKKALYNYMHGIGLDEDVRSWFSGQVPRTKVPRGYIARSIATVR